MTARVPVLSLWRGLLHRRRTLAELVAERGDDRAVMVSRKRDQAARVMRRGFIIAAHDEGHPSAVVGRFLGRDASTLRHIRREAGR